MCHYGPGTNGMRWSEKEAKGILATPCDVISQYRRRDGASSGVRGQDEFAETDPLDDVTRNRHNSASRALESLIAEITNK